MPKKARELSATEVRRLTDPGFYAVGGVAGLHLQVTKSGARSWVLRAKVGPRRRDIGLGGFPDVPLALAREKARDAREKIRDGIDPVEERRAARQALLAQQIRTITFEQCAEEVIAMKQAEHRNAKYRKEWRSGLETYAYPSLAKMAVNDIQLAHIVDVLKPHWDSKTVTMTRIRQRIEAVLAYAIAHGYREGANVAAWKGNLDAVLSKPDKIRVKSHYAALPIDDVPRFMRHLATMEGTGARCLEFIILTATRSGEARGAKWTEIDLEGCLWTIPGERMKGGREHRVPLSATAVRLLKNLPRFESTDLVFPSARDKPLAQSSLTAVIRRMDEALPKDQRYTDPTSGDRISVHGFRSAFRDWGGERTAYPGDVLEMSLAHTIKNKAEAAYRRGDLLEKRRRLMKDWAQFCAEGDTQGSVTPIRAMEG